MAGHLNLTRNLSGFHGKQKRRLLKRKPAIDRCTLIIIAPHQSVCFKFIYRIPQTNLIVPNHKACSKVNLGLVDHPPYLHAPRPHAPRPHAPLKKPGPGNSSFTYRMRTKRKSDRRQPQQHKVGHLNHGGNGPGPRCKN